MKDALVGVLIASGCAFKTDKYSHDILYDEKDREVVSNAIDPSIKYDFMLKPEGYIIGIEKTRGIDDYKTKCSDESFSKNNSNICEAVSSHMPSPVYGKDTLLTHIVRFSQNDPENSECILFNAHSDIDKGVQSNAPACLGGRFNSEGNKFKYMEEGLNSLSILKRDIQTRIEKQPPTHIFFVSTGWNTSQGESIKNYNDLFQNIKASADKNNQKFSPLVIGISWHSYIDNSLQGSVDFGGAQNDADEVGIFWAGPILHKVLEPIGEKYKIPVRLIGHSFGCRVVTQALATNKLYKDSPISSKPVLIGLQCAFSANRFLSKDTGKRSEDDSLENFSEISQKEFYTTSEHDLAVKKALVTYVGSSEFYNNSGEDKDFEKIINRSFLTESGSYKPSLDCNPNKISLINASNIIIGRAPGTGEGGGAHSVVWGAKAGQLIWDLLGVCKGE